MAKAEGKVLTFSAQTTTDYVRLPPGVWSMDMELGGSTVEVQARSYRSDDTSGFKALAIPLQNGTRGTTTSTNDVIEVNGGLDYRINCTAYVGAGTIRFSSVKGPS